MDDWFAWATIETARQATINATRAVQKSPPWGGRKGHPEIP